MSDLASTINKLQLLEELFNTREIFALYVSNVRKLMKWLEIEDYGIPFGLFLRFEIHITLPNILRLTQAASKKFQRRVMAYDEGDSAYDEGDKASTNKQWSWHRRTTEDKKMQLHVRAELEKDKLAPQHPAAVSLWTVWDRLPQPQKEESVFVKSTNPAKRWKSR